MRVILIPSIIDQSGFPEPQPSCSSGAQTAWVSLCVYLAGGFMQCRLHATESRLRKFETGQCHIMSHQVSASCCHPCWPLTPRPLACLPLGTLFTASLRWTPPSTSEGLWSRDLGEEARLVLAHQYVVVKQYVKHAGSNGVI